MSETLPITEARGKLGPLARRAAARRERIFLSEHGERLAAIVAVSELDDLEDALALAQHELRNARGSAEYIDHNEVGRGLGLAE